MSRAVSSTSEYFFRQNTIVLGMPHLFGKRNVSIGTPARSRRLGKFSRSTCAWCSPTTRTRIVSSTRARRVQSMGFRSIQIFVWEAHLCGRQASCNLWVGIEDARAYSFGVPSRTMEEAFTIPVAMDSRRYPMGHLSRSPYRLHRTQLVLGLHARNDRKCLYRTSR